MDNLYNSNKDLLFAYSNSAMGEKTAEIQQIANDLIETFFPEATTYLNTLDLDKEIISDFFGEEKAVLSDLNSDELVGLALFAYTIENYQDSIQHNPESAIANCFLEATGIAAGVAVIGSLSGKTIGKAAVNQ